MKNLDIREKAQENKVKLWEIAQELNINDGNFSRKLRKELSSEEKQTIFKLINKLSNTKIVKEWLKWMIL